MDYVWDAFYLVGLTSSPSLASIPVFPQLCQRNLYQHYEVDPEIIGQGSFGCIRRVKLLRRTSSGRNVDDAERKKSATAPVRESIYDRYYACKTIPKSKIYDRELFLREIYNLNRCQTEETISTGSGKNIGSFNNNHVIKLMDVMEDYSSIHIITELCVGGELFEYITKEHNRTGRGLRGKALSPSSSHSDDLHDGDETRCATIIFQILTAFRSIHEDANVCHRDMKASNFVFVQQPSFFSNSLDLRVIDFGLSKFVGSLQEERNYRNSFKDDCMVPDSTQMAVDSTKSNVDVIANESLEADGSGESGKIDDNALYSGHYQCMTSEVGTPYYVAPEVLKQQPEQHQMQSTSMGANSAKSDLLCTAGYTTKCDIWSIGVLAFLTLTGTFPVIGEDEKETVQKLMDSNLEVDFSDETLWEQQDLEESNGTNLKTSSLHGDKNRHSQKCNDTSNKKKPKISNSAMRFCKALLQREPEKRPTAREALQFDWIVNHCRESLSASSSPVTTIKMGTTPNSPRLSRLPSLSTDLGGGDE